MNTSHDYAAFIGIDWADEKHDVYLMADGKCEHCVIAQDAEALQAWVSDLRRRFDGRPVAVCLEQSRGGLIYALLNYEFLVLFPINPKQLSRYREALAPSGCKGDPADARLLCRFLAEHHNALRPWQPDDQATRALRILCEDRRHWVDQRTALGQQLRQRLKDYFPLALEFGSNALYADWFLELLEKFPSHAELRRAAPRTLSRILPKKNRVVDDEPEDPRVTMIRTAVPLVTDKAIVAGNRLAVLQLVKFIQQLNDTIAQYDQQIAKRMEAHPEAALFQSFPAAGEALAPRLLVAFGTDRTRYADAQDIQQFSGTAPVQIQSGKSRIVKRRRARPKFCYQTFHEYADHSRKKSVWARAYYLMLRSRGVLHHAALRSLAFKWQRIMFRCWKNQTPYDEQRHMNQLRLKQVAWLKYLDPQKTLQIA
jgi:transposase